MRVTIKSYKNRSAESYQTKYSTRVFFTLLNPLCEPTNEVMAFRENSPAYTCRDLLCTALLHSTFFDDATNSEYGSYVAAPINVEHGLFIAVGVECEDDNNLLTLTSRLSVLHEIETIIGFKKAELFTVSSNIFSNDYEGYPNNPLRQVLKLDPRWATDTPSFSLVTGVIRALVVNENFIRYSGYVLLRSLYDGNFKNRVVSYDDDVDEEDEIIMERALALFIENWRELHSSANSTVIGLDLSGYGMQVTNNIRYYCSRDRRKVINPLSRGGNGISWLLTVIAQDYTPETFLDIINPLKGYVQNESEKR